MKLKRRWATPSPPGPSLSAVTGVLIFFVDSGLNKAAQ